MLPMGVPVVTPPPTRPVVEGILAGPRPGVVATAPGSEDPIKVSAGIPGRLPEVEPVDDELVFPAVDVPDDDDEPDGKSEPPPVPPFPPMVPEPPLLGSM